MDLKQIGQELRSNLKREEIRTQNYIQGYADAVGEAIYLIEKYQNQIEKAEKEK